MARERGRGRKEGAEADCSARAMRLCTPGSDVQLTEALAEAREIVRLSIFIPSSSYLRIRSVSTLVRACVLARIQAYALRDGWRTRGSIACEHPYA